MTINESPSGFGGIAAAFVFGAGLLLVGFNLPPEMHERAVSMRWSGVTVLTVGGFALALTLAPTFAGRLLIGSLALALLSGTFAYHGAACELTGRANYHHGFGKGSWIEPVTCQATPVKFREATNMSWEAGLFFALASAGSFWFSRKIDYADEMF